MRKRLRDCTERNAQRRGNLTITESFCTQGETLAIALRKGPQDCPEVATTFPPSHLYLWIGRRIRDDVGESRVPRHLMALPSLEPLALFERVTVADLEQPSLEVVSRTTCPEMAKERQERLLDHVFCGLRRQSARPYIASQPRPAFVEKLQHVTLHILDRRREASARSQGRVKAGNVGNGVQRYRRGQAPRILAGAVAVSQDIVNRSMRSGICIVRPVASTHRTSRVTRHPRIFGDPVIHVALQACLRFGVPTPHVRAFLFVLSFAVAVPPLLAAQDTGRQTAAGVDDTQAPQDEKPGLQG